MRRPKMRSCQFAARRAGLLCRRIICAITSSVSETVSTTVPMALISGVMPRRIEEKT